MRKAVIFNKTLLIAILAVFAVSILIGYGTGIGSSKADDEKNIPNQIYITPDKNAVESNPTVPYYQKYFSELDKYESNPWALSELQIVGLMYDMSYVLPDMPDALVKSLVDKLTDLIERSSAFTSGESIDACAGQKEILSVLARWENKDLSQMYNDRSFLLNGIASSTLQEYGVGKESADNQTSTKTISQSAQDCSTIISAIYAFLGVDGNMDYKEFKNLIQLKKESVDASVGYSLELNDIIEILDKYGKSGCDKKYKDSVTSPLLEIAQRLQFLIDYPPGFYKQ
ncbi:hypothetical protein [Mahella australiensis]|uniref:Uncharacterized protein n=1 Tax=Mahella australiensis (strain DSM 15567 / CIP 107919 / 50-1 BON) TaxID=697281 RepID=F3ZVC2_MAHA5|nr:hypothetical protein [Mahella australiensis]AEE95272.1 hypothetical protein Mahau_0049 [Mahella australiensis 50-1 BON]